MSEKKEGQTTASAKPPNDKPGNAEKTKVKNYLKAKGAKPQKVDEMLYKDHSDRKAMAEELREWCKSLPKAKS